MWSLLYTSINVMRWLERALHQWRATCDLSSGTKNVLLGAPDEYWDAGRTRKLVRLFS